MRSRFETDYIYICNIIWISVTKSFLRIKVYKYLRPIFIIDNYAILFIKLILSWSKKNIDNNYSSINWETILLDNGKNNDILIQTHGKLKYDIDRSENEIYVSRVEHAPYKNSIRYFQGHAVSLFQTTSTSKKFFFFFFFFSSINPSIIAFSTLALLTEPQRLDARLSDVHFIEPPGTRAYTRLSLARIAAQTSNEQNDESTSRWIYPCRVNRVALVQVTGPLYIYKVSNKITDPWINKRRHQFALDIID